MPNQLSNLGIFHTVISIQAVVTGIVGLVRDGKINPRNSLGKWYIALTILACLTSFGVMKTGHFSPAHTLSVLILVLLPLGIYARRLNLFGGGGEKAEIVLMSATLFFSFIPAIVETLTRLPVENPIAENQDASVVKTALLGLTLIFAGGLVYQFIRLRKSRQA